MKLIVGLGNPGKEYAGTRHNCGFMVIDRLASKLNVDVDQNKFKGLYAKVKYHGEDIILLKPQTYMNLSGESVNAVMNFFKIDKEDLLVIYDDLDMPVGKLRLRKTGSAGGHNGIKNIIAHLNRHKYMNVADYVLSRFSKVESEAIEQGIENATNAVLDYLDNDFNHAMNYYN